MTPFNTFGWIYLQGGGLHELARKVTLMRVGQTTLSSAQTKRHGSSPFAIPSNGNLGLAAVAFRLLVRSERALALPLNARHRTVSHQGRRSRFHRSWHSLAIASFAAAVHSRGLLQALPSKRQSPLSRRTSKFIPAAAAVAASPQGRPRSASTLTSAVATVSSLWA